MTPTEVRLLVDYHYWARDRLLAAVAALTPAQFVQPCGGSFASIRDTLGHALGAEVVWLRRWCGESPTGLPPSDGFADLESLRRAWQDHEARMRAFLAPLDQGAIDRVVTYRSFAGQTAHSPLWQMLQHVVNHASYHRGQVVTLLRQLGAAAGQSQDLIAFYRERT